MSKTNDAVNIEQALSDDLLSLYATACSRLDSARQMKKAATEAEDKAKSDLVKLVDPLIPQHGTKLLAGGWVMQQTSGERRSISGDKLLSKGIDPAVIVECTDVSPFHSYKVSKEKVD